MRENVGDVVNAICYTIETVMWSCPNKNVFFKFRIVLLTSSAIVGNKKKKMDAWPEGMEGRAVFISRQDFCNMLREHEFSGISFACSLRCE